MRVNIYAEEITQRIEIIEKTNGDGTFTGVRFYLELPVTLPSVGGGFDQVAGPFQHHPNDDDSAAVTFWGKRDIRDVLAKAIDVLDKHHLAKKRTFIEIAEKAWAESRGRPRSDFGLPPLPKTAGAVVQADMSQLPQEVNTNACLNYYDGKCQSTTHTCIDCPDRR